MAVYSLSKAKAALQRRSSRRAATRFTLMCTAILKGMSIGINFCPAQFSIFCHSQGVKSPFALTAVLFFSSLSFAQPAHTSKRLPPAGIAIPAQVRSSLETGLQKLQREIAAFQTRPQSDWDTLLLPDAKIYEKAARYALEHNEFFRTNEFAIASQLIEEGIRRIQSLANGKAPWTTSDGLVVRA